MIAITRYGQRAKGSKQFSWFNGVFIFKNNTGDIVIGNAVSSAVNIGSYIKVMLGDIMADTYGTPYTGGGNYSLFNNLVTGLLRIG